jgi:amino acid adenylation domain-containing protein
MDCLHELVANQARRRPDAVAITAAGRHTTYRELDSAADGLAARLRKRAVGRGHLVGVALSRSPEAIVAILAVLRVGAAFLPLDPEYPAERLRFMVADAAPTVVITDDGRDFLPESVAAMSVRGEDAAFDDAVPVCEEDLAYVIYTSGSTGVPKGVQVPHRGITNRVRWELETYPLGPDDAVLHRTSLSFDIAVWEIFVPLCAGGRVVIAEPARHQDPEHLVELIGQERVTTIALVPSLLRALLEYDPGLRSCPTVRDVHCGGERLPPALRDELLSTTTVRLHNLYGPTEYSIDATYWDCRPNERGPVPIGRAIANTRLYVLDSDFREVSEGELYVAGAGLALGYLGRPELTAERFLPDPFAGNGERMYKTGDVVRRRPDGVLEFLGRADDQVKIRGFRVELGEVEAALAALPGVRQAVAHVRAQGEDNVLVGYLVPAADDLDLVESRRELAARVPAQLVPGQLVQIAEVPLGPTGKLDRAALPAPGTDDAASDLGDGDEAAIARIFAEVLGRHDFGIDDDFFELGGNSLQAVRLVNKLRRAFDADLGLPMLFQTATVAGITKAVNDR